MSYPFFESDPGVVGQLSNLMGVEPLGMINWIPNTFFFDQEVILRRRGIENAQSSGTFRGRHFAEFMAAGWYLFETSHPNHLRYAAVPGEENYDTVIYKTAQINAGLVERHGIGLVQTTDKYDIIKLMQPRSLYYRDHIDAHAVAQFVREVEAEFGPIVLQQATACSVRGFFVNRLTRKQVKKLAKKMKTFAPEYVKQELGGLPSLERSIEFIEGACSLFALIT